MFKKLFEEFNEEKKKNVLENYVGPWVFVRLETCYCNGQREHKHLDGLHQIAIYCRQICKEDKIYEEYTTD